MNKFDRFCYRHENWGIRNLMPIIILCNAVVYVLTAFLQTNVLIEGMAFWRPAVLRGEIWRLVTFVFIPPASGGILWVAIAMYLYFMIGRVLEMEWGRLKFSLFYLCGMVGTVAFCMITGAIADAQYINMSLFFAYATLFPEQRFLLFFVIPVKVKYLGIFSAALFVYGMIEPLLWGSPFRITMLAPLMALLNYFLFFAPQIRRLFVQRRDHKKSYDFQRTVRQSAKKPEYNGYTHKCAECGVTDAERPDLEFRYCSLCSHYECYCNQHLFTHKHRN